MRPERSSAWWGPSEILHHVHHHHHGSRSSPPRAVDFCSPCAPLGNHAAAGDRCEIKLCHLFVKGSPITVHPWSKDNGHLKEVLQRASEPRSFPLSSQVLVYTAGIKGLQTHTRSCKGLSCWSWGNTTTSKEVSVRALLSAESQTAWSRQNQPIPIITRVMENALVFRAVWQPFFAQWRTVYRIWAHLFHLPNAAEETNTLVIKAN